MWLVVPPAKRVGNVDPPDSGGTSFLSARSHVVQ